VQRLHIFGASGSGTTTLGAALAREIHGLHLDTDDFYWLPTDPPYTSKRPSADRVVKIRQASRGASSWVLSGSICSWGDPLLADFSAAVFVTLDPLVRLARLATREQARHGERILPGGDMHAAHLEFMDWAQSYDSAQSPIRSLHLHETWLRKLSCPVLRLDSSAAPDELVQQVLDGLHACAD